MDARRKFKRALWTAAYRNLGEGDPGVDLRVQVPMTKIAGFDDEGDVSTSTPPAPTSRSIPKGHDYDPKALKPLAKMLWAMSVSMGHALTAYRQFTKLKSSAISPDGKLGGRGYVMDVRDVRKRLYEACEALSAISDTIHDEINAPHWKPKLEQLTKGDEEDIRRYVDKAEEVMDEASEVEDGEDDTMPADSTDDPTTEEDESQGSPVTDEEEDEPGSGLPDGGDPETLEDFHKGKGKPKSKNKRTKTASVEMHLLTDTADVFGVIPNEPRKRANSSLPVELLPGGPRVDHIDRGEQLGPWGSYNKDEVPSEDHDHRYRENETGKFAAPVAESAMPGSLTDKTETNADDFGIGGGQNPRSGEGLSHTPAPPSGKGVWGPSAGLPDDPGTRTVDPQSGSEALQFRLDSQDPVKAAARVIARFRQALSPTSAFLNEGTAFLPNDMEEPVARSDYYPGAKGNTVSESGLPGSGMPAKDTPLVQRPVTKDSLLAESTLPGDGSSGPQQGADRGDPGPSGAVYEDVTTPYVRIAPDVHQYAPDPAYTYSRPKSARTPTDG